MMSPVMMPAFSAGLPFWTPVTYAPCGGDSFARCPSSRDTSRTLTPIDPPIPSMTWTRGGCSSFRSPWS
jgi:hypothetical protein